MSDPRPIGMFDSGVGGLTVLRAVHDLLPDESTIYLGDLAHFPYGPKDREEVRTRARAVTEHLAGRDIKALVVACNTATSAAISTVERMVEMPVIGVVRPGAEEAVRKSSRHSIGVVATQGSVQSHAYLAAIQKVCEDCFVREIALGQLVDLIEQGRGDDLETRNLIASVVDELVDRDDCDTIVLGCTHFPLVRREFERASAGRAIIVDSATSTARHLKQILETAEILAGQTSPTHEFFATAHADSFVTQAQRLFGEHVRASVVDIPSATEVMSATR